jgi:hypothetical protein
LCVWNYCSIFSIKNIFHLPALIFFKNSIIIESRGQFRFSRKYTENTEVNKYRFKGKRIIPIVGIPEHTIVLGEFTSGMESNLWMGVDYANDMDVLKPAASRP